MSKQHILDKYKLTEEKLESGIELIAKNLGEISDSHVMMAVADLLANGDIRIPEQEVPGNDEGLLIGDVVEVTNYSPDCHLSQVGTYIGVVVDHPEVGLCIAMHDLFLIAKNEEGIYYPQFFQANGWGDCHDIKLLYRENRNRREDEKESYYDQESRKPSANEISLELLDYLLDVDPNYDELEALRDWIEGGNSFKNNKWLLHNRHSGRMNFIEAERVNKENDVEKVTDEIIVQMIQEEFDKTKEKDDLTPHQKDIQFASLMTLLERHLGIPLFDKLDKRIPGHVLYKKISDERSWND